MVLEWAPEAPTTAATEPAHSVDAGQNLGKGFRLLTPEEHAAAAPVLTPARADALKKSFLLLSGGKEAGMGDAELANAIQAIADAPPTGEQTAAAMAASAGSPAGSVSLAGFTELLRTRHLLPAHQGRYYVAVSLAEAETIRRVLHVRGRLPLVSRGAQTAEVALRYSPLASPGTGSLLGDGGVAFDTSAGWRRGPGVADPKRRALVDCTGATVAEAAVAQSAFRFFDGDMHYSEPQLSVLVRALQASPGATRSFRTVVGYLWQSFVRDLHSSHAVLVVIFCQHDA
jgi:hypothetical protein